MTGKGKGFEAEVAGVLAQYEFKRQMRVRKVDPPTRIIGNRVIMLENPFLDFVGCWTESGGRAVLFEAKSTKEPKLPLGNGGITDKQIDALENWQAAGAVTFVLWQHLGAVKLVPTRCINQALTGGRPDGKERKHLKWEIDGFPVPQGTGYVTFDFRQLMLTLWPTRS